MLNLRTGGFWRFDLDDVKTAFVYSRGGGGGDPGSCDNHDE